MHNGTNESMLSSCLRHRRVFLLVCWMAGFVLGIAFSYATETFSSMMRGILTSPVSIVGLGAVIVLPYLITAAAVFTSQWWVLMALAFSKAFLFGACCAAVDLSFFTAGWLVRILVLFSDLLLMPVLIWLWLRCLNEQHPNILCAIMLCAVVSILIGCIDYCVIAPFLASVI